MTLFNANIKLNLIAAFAVFSFFIIFAGCSEVVTPTESGGDLSSDNSTDALYKNNVVKYVSMGGADICEALGLPTGCDANFSLTAIEKADGTVMGQWQDTFSGGFGGIHVAIDCVNVIDNAAIVGGVITKGKVGDTDVSGQYAITVVVDNGTSANDPKDQMSFSFFPAEDFFGNATCNDLTLDDFQGFLIDLTNGQVVVASEE